MKKRYYFSITKGSGKAAVVLFLVLRNKKFYIRHSIYSNELMYWWQAHWYWILFNLPSWIKKNGEMFGYKKTQGRIKLNNF